MPVSGFNPPYRLFISVPVVTNGDHGEAHLLSPARQIIGVWPRGYQRLNLITGDTQRLLPLVITDQSILPQTTTNTLGGMLLLWVSGVILSVFVSTRGLVTLLQVTHEGVKNASSKYQYQWHGPHCHTVGIGTVFRCRIITSDKKGGR